MRHMLKELLPPAVARLVRRARGVVPMRYAGPFADWASADAHASGYAAPEILERVRAAALAVRRGDAASERDAVACARLDPPFPVIAGLLHAAMRSGGRLSVLDFGGALGSSLHQCRSLLGACATLEWGVVEQEHFVRCGRAEFQDDTLRFHDSIDACRRASRPNAALLSGVLHYLPDPARVLREIASHPIDTIIVDRTPFSDRDDDLIAVQHVPPSIYRASYPLRIFSRRRFTELLRDLGDTLAEFDAPVDAPGQVGGTAFRFGGMILRRRGAE